MYVQVEERHDVRSYFQVEAQSKPIHETEAINPQPNYSKCFDDDGRLKRTGTGYLESDLASDLEMSLKVLHK